MLIPFDKFYEEYLKSYAANLEAHKKACAKYADRPETFQWGARDMANGVAMLRVGEAIVEYARALAVNNEEKTDHFDRAALQAEMERQLLNATLDLKGSYTEVHVAIAVNWAKAVSNGYSHCNAANAALKTVEWRIQEEERNIENRKHWWKIKKVSCAMWRTSYGSPVKYTRKPILASMWKWDELPRLQHNEEYSKGAEIGQ